MFTITLIFFDSVDDVSRLRFVECQEPPFGHKSNEMNNNREEKKKLSPITHVFISIRTNNESKEMTCGRVVPAEDDHFTHTNTEKKKKIIQNMKSS